MLPCLKGEGQTSCSRKDSEFTTAISCQRESWVRNRTVAGKTGSCEASRFRIKGEDRCAESGTKG